MPGIYSRISNVIMHEQLELDNKVALVTGAARGIGRAIALDLACRGAKVAINYARSESEAAAVLSEIEAFGGTALMEQADVADPLQCNSMLQHITERWGDVHLLVNNAAIGLETPIERISPEQWLRTIAVNLNGVYFLTRAVLPAMRASHFGRIVNVGSVAGITGGVVSADYAASKAALIGLTKRLARELTGSGVSVNVVAPAFIYTDMSAPIITKYPGRPVGKPEDVSEVVGMLCSLRSPHLSGAVIEVTGGT